MASEENSRSRQASSLSFPLRKLEREGIEPLVGHYGGHPRGIRSTQWPRCRVCGAPMCFLAQLDAGPHLPLGPYARMSLFICHATGGRCEDWEPFKGANRVVLQRVRDDSLYDGPHTVRVYRRLKLTIGPEEDERELLRAALARGLSRREALGVLRRDKVGGGPVWWHRDDTPMSRAGTGPMVLLAQLTTQLVTFDITRSGVAYVFQDPHDAGEESAVLLWQAEG